MNGENWVVKSNALVECKTKMTALEQKIIHVLASEIDKDDEDFKEYEFNIKDFIDLVGCNETTIYKDIHKAVKKLMQKVVTFERGESIITTAFLSGAKTVARKGKVYLCFNPYLKPELLGLKKIFTQYKLKNVLSIQGTHSIRIYELLKQYEKMKKRNIKVHKLKEFLGLQNKYNAFTDFEKRILKPSKVEINKKTDLKIDYIKIKKGRKIIELEFTIESKLTQQDEQKKLIGALYNDEQIQDIKNKCGLQNEKFTKVQVMEIYELGVNKTADQELDPYTYIQINYKYSIGKAKNMYSYLKIALSEDYANAIMCMKMLIPNMTSNYV